MFIFLRLLLAHLTADFLLQPDWLIRTKLRHHWGVLLHGGIVGLTAFLFAAPYLSNPLVVTLLAAAAMIHIFQDKAKLLITVQAERNHLGTCLLDQFLHILAMGVVAFFCTGLPRSPFPLFTRVLDPIYTNDAIMVFAIWTIILTYGMFVLQEFIKRILRTDTQGGLSFPGFRMKYFGIVSRAGLGIGLWAGAFSPLGYILSGLAVLSYILMARSGRLPVLDCRISIVAATLIGILMRLTV